MKKPISLMQFIGVVFLFLGPFFIIAGYLNYIEILPTDPASQGNPAIVFPILGVVILLIGIGLFYIPLRRLQKRSQLKSKGTRVTGIVTSVRELSSVHWGKESPYRVKFCYEYEGKQHTGRSNLLWSAPTISKGESIEIYMNQDKKNQYWVEI